MGITNARLPATDYDDWLKLFREWQEYLAGSVPISNLERTWQLLCDGQSGLIGLIAKREDGESVGLVHASLTPFAWSGGPTIYLQDLFVTASARGEGIGTLLMNAAYRLADEKGASQVFWLANEEDSDLRRFYDRQRLGHEYQTCQPAWQQHGTALDLAEPTLMTP
jgi:GNAT superfamily N-acetyltransferase